MSRICVQRGHCFRTKGATGTACEQQITASLGARIAPLLAAQGHRVSLIGADDAVPTSDIFVALHTDGSTNPATRGASVGYPDDRGGKLAAAWKRAHQRNGFPGGWHRDNYTAALRGYYGFGKAKRANSACVCFLAEHGTTTNRDDLAWLQTNLDACARAHAEAIAEFLGIRPVQEVVKVEPRMNVLIAGVVVDVLRAPNGGVRQLTDSGAIYAWFCADHGAPGRHPEYWGNRRASQFEKNADGTTTHPNPDGYVVVAASGERYSYPSV